MIIDRIKAFSCREKIHKLSHGNCIHATTQEITEQKIFSRVERSRFSICRVTNANDFRNDISNLFFMCGKKFET